MNKPTDLTNVPTLTQELGLEQFRRQQERDENITSCLFILLIVIWLVGGGFVAQRMTEAEAQADGRPVSQTPVKDRIPQK